MRLPWATALRAEFLQHGRFLPSSRGIVVCKQRRDPSSAVKAARNCPRTGDPWEPSCLPEAAPCHQPWDPAGALRDAVNDGSASPAGNVRPTSRVKASRGEASRVEAPFTATRRVKVVLPAVGFLDRGPVRGRYCTECLMAAVWADWRTDISGILAGHHWDISRTHSVLPRREIHSEG